MKHNPTRALLIGLAAALLCTACFQGRHSLVKVCTPTDKLLREANTKYADHTPLTADDLRGLLLDDTTHYKLLVVYSYCCGPCHERMQDTYLPLMRSLDTTRCRLYFVLEDCGSLPWNASLLESYGISTRYYLRDADSLFLYWRNGKPSNHQNWTNVANYITSPRRAFTWCEYVPLNLIVSPDGRVKQVYEQYADGGFLTAYSLSDMLHRDKLSVQNLDFDRVDTVHYDFAYGMEDVYRDLDTSSFRHHRRPIGRCTPDGHCF